jgi:hypothetical protein
MELNRRTMLLGLSAAGVGAGAAFGSGAFTSVSADRSVNVNVTSDDSGLIQITGDYIINNDGNNNDGVAEFAITNSELDNAEGLNPEATTVFEQVMQVKIADSGNQSGAQYTITFSDASSLATEGIDFTVNSPSSDGTVTNGSGYPLEVQDVGETELVVLDVEIDTTGDTAGDTLSGQLGIGVQIQ